MLTDVSQRWRGGRHVFVPPTVVFDPRRYEVANIADDTTARAFVVATHYSGSYPAARERFGLYEGTELVGVAVFSHPTNDKVLARLPCDRLEGVELGRLVLVDRVPFNAESWMIARCFELLKRDGYRGVVSFADPCPRFCDEQDEPVFPGHVGGVYKASNAVYVGRATARTLRLFKRDGRVFSARTMQKIRKAERGWESAVAMLVGYGAAPLDLSVDEEARRAWLTTWTEQLTRTMQHRGNLTYLFGLDAKTKKRLPTSLPYPKIDILKARIS
jgi:hypothetical protein